MTASPELDELEIGLRSFVRESNRIEGIRRAPTKREVEAHRTFIHLEKVRQTDLELLVAVCAPGKPIRDRVGMSVRVGHHVPPGGGRHILEQLWVILNRVERGSHPFSVHCQYETLHPFMDGNGRSGRALWLWQMLNQDHGDGYALQRGFLHTYYYQSFSQARP